MLSTLPHAPFPRRAAHYRPLTRIAACPASSAAAMRCPSIRSQSAAPFLRKIHERRPAAPAGQSRALPSIRLRLYSTASKASDGARKGASKDHNRTRRKTFAGLSALVLLVLIAQSPSGKLYLESLYAPEKQQRPDLLELENIASPSPSSETIPQAPGRIPISEAHLHPIPPETFTYVDPRPFRHMPFGDLFSRYAVFTMCCFPSLVERAPALLEWALEGTNLPGVKSLTEWIIKKTFFKQFVGAETAEGCIPVLAQLSRDNLGALFAFSVEMIKSKDGSIADLNTLTKQSRPSPSPQSEEGKETQPSKHIYDAIIDDLIESVRVAAHFASSRPAWADSTSPEERLELENRPSRDGSTMVAIKLSGVLKDPSVLERASSAIVSREFFSSPPRPLPPSNVNGRYGPCAGLAIPIAALQNKEDAEALKELWQGVRKLAKEAQKAKNVRCIIDAEYSWFQPAIDAMYEALAEEFNRVPSAQESGTAGAKDAWYKRIWGRRLHGGSFMEEHAVPGEVRGPLIYNTYQAYLRRTPSYLAASLERARAHGYTLGVKLVRGAYVDQENAEWEEKDVRTPPPSVKADREVREAFGENEEKEWRSPVWRNKMLTDLCYDGCAVRLVDEIALDRAKGEDKWPSLAVIFATHNWQSALKVTRRMLDVGLCDPPAAEILRRKQIELAEGSSSATFAEARSDPRTELVLLQVAPGIRGRIFFGQLLGMADSLTRRLQLAFDPYSGGVGPHMGLKYVPYGPLQLVMPYLVRRSIENKTVMQGGKDGEEGAAATERKLAGREIRRRFIPFLN